ncbi:diaminopimelate decarboxylase [Buchnera aphidicola]|uniref:diaminopimelate decarboxylase n=1 Tax=Buchnera aphidicola TaxID=9 RepID=UPI003463BC1B
MFSSKKIFFINIHKEKILKIIKLYNTPLWMYNSDIIESKIKKLKEFDTIRFAQKACSNIHILRFMKEKKVKVDAVSDGEIKRALFSGFDPKNNEIIYTADIFNIDTLSTVVKFNIPVNVGSIDMLSQLGKISPKHHIWLRINPKFGHGHSKKTNTGGENSKHGIWDPKLAIKIIKKYNLKLVGLHMHIGSGVDYFHLKKVCDAMVKYAIDLNQKISSISAGGGLSIPYQTNEKSIDIEHYFSLWNNARNKISRYLGKDIHLEIEPGRFLVGESGILITQVRSVKKMGTNNFVLVDAGFNDLMRPVMYGSYHEISVISGNKHIINYEKKIKTIVAGPLCESGDVFTQCKNGNIKTRLLPKVVPGDYLIFHNTGAYGASMSSNYNSRPLIPEVLFKKNSFHLIRRRQTIEDLIKLEI